MTDLGLFVLGLVAGYCIGPLYMLLHAMTKAVEKEGQPVDPFTPKVRLTRCETCKGRCKIRNVDGKLVECVACGGGGYEVE